MSIYRIIWSYQIQKISCDLSKSKMLLSIRIAIFHPKVTWAINNPLTDHCYYFFESACVITPWETYWSDNWPFDSIVALAPYKLPTDPWRKCVWCRRRWCSRLVCWHNRHGGCLGCNIEMTAVAALSLFVILFIDFILFSTPFVE